MQAPQNRQTDGFCKPPQKGQIGGAFAIFHVLGTKKHRKYRCFWLRANAKPRYLRGFEPLLPPTPPTPPPLERPQAMTNVGTCLSLHVDEPSRAYYQERYCSTLQPMNKEDLVEHLYVKRSTLNSCSCYTTSKQKHAQK